MKVLISGGGIAGLTLALCLHRNGHMPLIVEKSPRLRSEGYMIDFFGPGYDTAEKLGLLPQLEEIHYPIAYLSFVAPDGKERYALRYTDLRKLLNNHHFNFMRGDLEKLLYEQIVGDIEVRFGTKISSFEQDDKQVHITLSDGTAESFDLLVGADGIHSWVRSKAFDPESRFLRYLGYNTGAFVIDEPLHITVRRDAFQTLTEPRRQMAVYPIRGDRVATFFVYKAGREPLPSYSTEAARAELQRVFGDLGWAVPQLLQYSRHVDDIYFDSVSQVEMPAWSAGRVVLVGDACQCPSLLAGQGASMAMTGAYVLAEELSMAGSTVASALARYEQQVKPDILKRQASGRKIAGWFVPDSRLQLVLRDLFTRFSTWPVVSTFVSRTLNAGSKV